MDRCVLVKTRVSGYDLTLPRLRESEATELPAAQGYNSAVSTHCQSQRRPLPPVTVGFVPKQRFSSAALSLAALYKNAGMPFRLIVVDANIPSTYRTEMEAVLKGREHYEFVSFTRFLQTNEQKQVVIDMVDDGYILLFENDNIPSPDFLTRMMDACLDHPDGCVVIPELLEGPPHKRRIHHSTGLGRIEVFQEDGRIRRKIHPDESIPFRNLGPRLRRVVPATETHILLFHKSVMDRIGGLDIRINTREGHDLSFQLHHAGIPIILEPAAEAVFIQTPPVEKEELAFFMFSWDKEKARETNACLARKWDVVDFPDSAAWVATRKYQTHWLKWLLFRCRARLRRGYSLMTRGLRTRFHSDGATVGPR
jgi:hypothetical protein